MSPQANSTTITQLTPSGVSAATLRRWTLRARRRLHLSGAIAVTVVPPKISQQWNKQYRRRDRPTNVLSFDYAHQKKQDEHILDGEILLCPSVIKHEAKELGETYRARLQMLLEHGCIHLLGLDHHTTADQRRWEKYEQRLV